MTAEARQEARGAEIVCDSLVKIFKVADIEVVALGGLDLVVEPGELVAVVGASGSGKSTLLNILGGLDAPSAGRAVVGGHDLSAFGDAERTRYRRRTVGFVWQQTARNLLPYLSAVENVELPMVLEGGSERRGRALELLERVGLAERARHRPEALSGGEQQRVAIAVALANEPRLLLADEPTGELDSGTAAEVFEVLRRLNEELATTIVVVTHDPLVARHVSRTIAIRDGRTSSETVHRRERAEDGTERTTTEEFAVLDRAGRVQLPRPHVRALGLAGRVRLRLETDHVGVWRDETRRPAPAASGALAAAHGAAIPDPTGLSRSAPNPARVVAGARPIAEATAVTREYRSPGSVVHALRGVDLSVRRGELLAIRGRSGSGKTTLLNLLGGLDTPTAGRIELDGRDLASLSEEETLELRRTGVGFIFQTFALVPILSAAENVEVPLRLVRADGAARDARVVELLALVGLADRARHRPHELSGGEQQRVAIARALANRPPLLLADEPTAQLDSDTGQRIMGLLHRIVAVEGTTVVVATHDPLMLDAADRVVELRDGLLVDAAAPLV